MTHDVIPRPGIDDTQGWRGPAVVQETNYLPYSLERSRDCRHPSVVANRISITQALLSKGSRQQS